MEGTGKIVKKVNPRGTSKGLTYDNPLRDYISANRIKWGRDYPDMPVERRPLPYTISAKEVVMGQAFLMNQEAPCKSWG